VEGSLIARGRDLGGSGAVGAAAQRPRPRCAQQWRSTRASRSWRSSSLSRWPTLRQQRLTTTSRSRCEQRSGQSAASFCLACACRL
jgi:hypothetical protein